MCRSALNIVLFVIDSVFNQLDDTGEHTTALLWKSNPFKSERCNVCTRFLVLVILCIWWTGTVGQCWIRICTKESLLSLYNCCIWSVRVSIVRKPIRRNFVFWRTSWAPVMSYRGRWWYCCHAKLFCNPFEVARCTRISAWVFWCPASNAIADNT